MLKLDVAPSHRHRSRSRCRCLGLGSIPYEPYLDAKAEVIRTLEEVYGEEGR